MRRPSACSVLRPTPPDHAGGYSLREPTAWPPALAETQPDVACLLELKAAQEKFPPRHSAPRISGRFVYAGGMESIGSFRVTPARRCPTART